MRSKASLLLVVLAALVAGTTGLVWRELAAEVDAPTVRPAWPRGVRYDYKLVWQGHARLAAESEASFDSRIDLQATLRLVGHGERDGGWLVAASFADIAGEAMLLGKNALGERTQLVGPTAWVIVAKDGHVERVYFEPSAPQVFKHLMQTVVGLAAITTGEGEAWHAIEPGPSGTARVAYHREGTRWSRRRVGYDKITVAPPAPHAVPELAGRAAIEVDARSGHLVSLTDDETFRLRIPGAKEPLFDGTSQFSLVLASHGEVTAPAPVALASLEVRAPGDATQAGDVETNLRRQAAGDLTREGLVFGLARGWTEGSARRAWMHKAVALVQLHPELCADVLEAFGSGDGNVQRLAFDLLAAVGTPEAQAAMREGLASPHPLAVELVQRFSFVEKPTVETARFVIAAWKNAGDDANLASATTYTLGAIARHLGRSAVGDEINAQLRDALASATTSRGREDALAALGNTARVENVAAIRGHARDESVDVRSRAAWALRDMPTREAREALVEITRDADPRVARSALQALARQTLDGDDLDRLEAAMRGPLAEATASALVDLLGFHLQDGAAVRRMLEAIAAGTYSNHLQARVRVLLDQINS